MDAAITIPNVRDGYVPLLVRHHARCIHPEGSEFGKTRHSTPPARASGLRSEHEPSAWTKQRSSEGRHADHKTCEGPSWTTLHTEEIRLLARNMTKHHSQGGRRRRNTPNILKQVAFAAPLSGWKRRIYPNITRKILLGVCSESCRPQSSGRISPIWVNTGLTLAKSNQTGCRTLCGRPSFHPALLRQPLHERWCVCGEGAVPNAQCVAALKKRVRATREGCQKPSPLRAHARGHAHERATKRRLKLKRRQWRWAQPTKVGKWTNPGMNTST